MADAGDFGGSVPERKRNTVRTVIVTEQRESYFREVDMSLKGRSFTMEVE